MRNKELSGKIAFAASEYGKERGYWLNKLSGKLVKCSFPFDFDKIELKGRKKGAVDIEVIKTRITGKLFFMLMKLSKKSDYTLHMILTAGIISLLNKYTHSNDIIVGMPIYKQEFEGEFLNTVLALRNKLKDNTNFKELLLQVRHTIVEANENQNYPIETLLYQLNLPFSESDFPLFDVVLLLENIHDKRYIQHIHPNIVFSFLKTDEYIEGTLEYNSLLYLRETIERIIKHLIRLLEKAVSITDLPLSDIDILSEEEKKQLLFDFNDTQRKYPDKKTIDELFEEHAEKTPGKIAVNCREDSLTYGTLNEQSDRLAGYLRSKGLQQEEAVGILTENSIKMIIGLLGILKGGGAYLPLNSEYPEERKKCLLNDGAVKILLISGEEAANHGPDVIDLSDSEIYKTHHKAGRNHRYDNLAYVIYTSGSTGIPKGVLVEHRSVVRLVKNTNYVKFMEDDRILQTGALDFDASTFEIWGALLNGLRLYLASKETILTAEELKKTMLKNKITTIWMTSPLFNQMLDMDIEIFSRLRTLIAGGDTLSPAHINRLRSWLPGLQVINGYGPTENTTFSTTHQIEQEYKESIPIGKPIANSTAYIVNKHNHLVPLGVAGELWLGGDGLARGYMNNPELTSETFIIDPFIAGDRIYRTGDLARWLLDGSIEFLGRIDQQVKIRGYRIEPGEIENHLTGLDVVSKAVVITRDGEGEKFLCAYVVPEGGRELDVLELKNLLSKNLPDYMIPSYFVQLEAIPLTVNGKIERKALPEPDAYGTGRSYIAPRNKIEEKLAEVWSEVLDIAKENIGIDANFFELGGHSLKATLLISRIHKRLEIKIPLANIFMTPTIRELSEYVKGKVKDKFVSIEPVAKKDDYPLSSAQKRLFILQHIDAGITNYNIPMVVGLEGQLDARRLEDTFKKLIKRHESLRTSFEMKENQPVQKIHEGVDFNIKYYTEVEPGIGSGDEIDDKKIQKWVDDFVKPFDLSRAPLLRVALMEIEKTKYVLMLDIHHIITDGTSMHIFIREFMALYDGEELPPLKIQYKDFSQWQNNLIGSGEMKKMEAFWLETFRGEIPVLNLPTDYERPEIQSFEGAKLDFVIGSEQTKELNDLAVQEGATFFMVLLAIYNIFLSKISGQEDIVIGTPIAGRRHSDLEHLIGMFVNTLALRNFPTGEKTFVEFLKEVKDSTLEAFNNQDYQFENLVEKLTVERNPSRNPLFDVMFSLQNMYVASGDIPETEISDFKLIPYNYGREISKYDFIFTAEEFESKVSFTISYSTRLFKRETIETFIRHFKKIVAETVEDYKQKIADIKIISDEEKSNLLDNFRDDKEKLFLKEVDINQRDNEILDADFEL
jgi:amino acid adenylation domain-containing protein